MDQDASSQVPAGDAPPKLQPEAFTLRTPPRPVTRLNRRTLAILVGGLAIAVIGATMWSLDPKQRRINNDATELYNVDGVSPTESLDRLPSDYSKLSPPVPELGPPLPGDLGPAIIKSQGPVVADYSPPGQDPAVAEQDALRKEAEAAVTSSVFFRSSNSRAGSSVQNESANLPGMQPLEAGAAPTSTQMTDPTTLQNGQEQKRAFQTKKAGTAETRSSAELQMPVSPYQVMAGTVISAALVTGIKSDLPGDVIGTVTEPVYDTATGRHLLIPQGSRILGRYNSQVSYGQRRVQVVWDRVILPDTSSLTLDSLAGTDPAGYAGLEDGIDSHWDRIFAGAALTTLLGVGAELAAPEKRQSGDRIVIAGRDSFKDSVNQVGQEMTRRNLNIQSTLTDRPSLPVRIITSRDLVLRPYQPLFFNPRAMPQESH